MSPVGAGDCHNMAGGGAGGERSRTALLAPEPRTSRRRRDGYRASGQGRAGTGRGTRQETGDRSAKMRREGEEEGGKGGCRDVGDEVGEGGSGEVSRLTGPIDCGGQHGADWLAAVESTPRGEDEHSSFRCALQLESGWGVRQRRWNGTSDVFVLGRRMECAERRRTTGERRKTRARWAKMRHTYYGADGDRRDTKRPNYNKLWIISKGRRVDLHGAAMGQGCWMLDDGAWPAHPSDAAGVFDWTDIQTALPAHPAHPAHPPVALLLRACCRD